MCLYHGDDLAGLPWLDLDEFLALLTRWFSEAENGWEGDFPLLDLDLYVTRDEEEHRLVLYADLDDATWVRFNQADKFILCTRKGSRPGRHSKPRENRKLFGYVASIGEPQVPITDWAGLALLLGESREVVERAIRECRIDVLLVRYERLGNDAVLALTVRCDDSDSIEIRSLRSASIDKRDLTLRAGATAADLREKKVLVVGAGAVGSFVADSLARSGIGTLHIADPDIVKPGNLIRHLAGSSEVGWNKAEAVKRVIEKSLYQVSQVMSVPAFLLAPAEAELAYETYDLIVDATADGRATALLHHAAETSGKHFLSVCLKEDGKVVRVDVIPPITGEPLPTTPESPRDRSKYVYDGGCGDPVSMTPHAAVIEAAAIATRHAIGLLTDSPLSSAGEIRDYR
jgi:molybdopterin/thiamine biosynthesis adenylyltransferase